MEKVQLSPLTAPPLSHLTSTISNL